MNKEKPEAVNMEPSVENLDCYPFLLKRHSSYHQLEIQPT
jgi:hypothetical protein